MQQKNSSFFLKHFLMKNIFHQNKCGLIEHLYIIDPQENISPKPTIYTMQLKGSYICQNGVEVGVGLGFAILSEQCYKHIKFYNIFYNC